ncbi:DNA-binding FadR family transcriptional regulator [Conyzicola lurida]|uniref:DNA-binding FadR family transcriptional regulator n=1 Tax=Conyzicola lurida TaxID=1172621 RepID=A0A841ARC4_9MICO|nr:FCD domain-containing protein [Conyzicola lurida]MBB5844115.1 DNA-binding FadR family transcriptional regulator [Conyzicola lurida]
MDAAGSTADTPEVSAPVGDPAGQSLADEIVFRPVRSGNAFEDTVARLLQAVRLGIVEPGGALPPERDLAVRFSVSRDTVRDAIRSLSEAGYLIARRGRYGGTFVSERLPVEPLTGGSPPSEAELDDVLGLREILEIGAARAAAGRSLSADDRDGLWQSLTETAAASVDDYRRLDSRLHLTIGQLVGSPSLVSLMADNRTRVNELLDRIPLLPLNIAHSNEQHEAIVAAILTGNRARAAEAMSEHLDGSAVLLRGFLG